MNLKDFSAGLDILRAHYDKPDGYHLEAEHDQIHLSATDRPLSDVDVTRLRELGWFQPGREEDEYIPDEGWTAFA